MRDRDADTDPGAPFFVSRVGGLLPRRAVENVFERMRHQLCWQAQGDHANPRIHDLRCRWLGSYVPRVGPGWPTCLRRYSPGWIPFQRLKARWNALASLNPIRAPMSSMLR